MTGKKPTVCVYCGSRFGNDKTYEEAAKALGERLAQDGNTLVYGAGTVGLMGVVARAALDKGGDVIGVIPDHLDDVEITQDGLTETITTNTMHERKKIMFDRSDAFVVLPGGLGTMDETFEVLTWAQLGLHDHPIVVWNVGGFWTSLKDFVWKMCDAGFVDAKTLEKLIFVDTLEEVIQTIDTAYEGPRAEARSDLF